MDSCVVGAAMWRPRILSAVPSPTVGNDRGLQRRWHWRRCHHRGRHWHPRRRGRWLAPTGRRTERGWDADRYPAKATIVSDGAVVDLADDR